MYRIANRVVNRNIELKYVDYTSPLYEIYNDPTVIRLVQIENGTGNDGDRVGERVRSRFLRLRIDLQGRPTAAETTQMVRYIVFRTHNDNRVIPPPETILTTVGGEGCLICPKVFDNSKKWSILAEGLVRLCAATADEAAGFPSRRIVAVNKKLYHTMQFTDGEDDEDPIDGGIYLLLCSGSATVEGTGPTAMIQSRFYFKDG